MKKNEISKLTGTAEDFFHLLAKFVKVNNLSNEMTAVTVNDELQEIYSNSCSLFQLYFYINLFDPNDNSKILNDKQLTKTTVETMLNKIFSTNKKGNQCKVAEFVEEYNISKN